MNESEIIHKLGQIEGKIDSLMLLNTKADTRMDKHEERIDAVETWQIRAQARIAASVAILTVGAQVAKEFLSRHTS